MRRDAWRQFKLQLGNELFPQFVEVESRGVERGVADHGQHDRLGVLPLGAQIFQLRFQRGVAGRRIAGHREQHRRRFQIGQMRAHGLFGHAGPFRMRMGAQHQIGPLDQFQRADSDEAGIAGADAGHDKFHRITLRRKFASVPRRLP